MDSKRAAQELRKLRAQANEPDIRREGPANRGWKAKVGAVMAAGLGGNSETLRQFRDLRYHVGIWSGAPGERERDAHYFANRVDDAASLIDAAIYELDLREEPQRPPMVPDLAGPIFVVHGHDDARKYELVRLLERAAGPDPLVLHERADRGQTIIEKFEHHAQAASFAVVLLTGDDVGRLRSADSLPLRARGRQNVVLEMGFFIGLLGRSRVVVLKDADVEVPSDLSGVVYIELDSGKAWCQKLLKELEAAGIDVDYSKAR